MYIRMHTVYDTHTFFTFANTAALAWHDIMFLEFTLDLEASYFILFRRWPFVASPKSRLLEVGDVRRAARLMTLYAPWR